MREFNRHLIETNYDWERIIDKLESIYTEILQSQLNLYKTEKKEENLSKPYVIIGN
jgi:hypothetical protein